MKFKPGVVLAVVEAIAKILPVIDEVWQLLAGREAVVTSGTDGKHKPKSKHYVGCAVDLRTRDLSHFEVAKCADKLRDRLGRDYDVVVEADHMHVEYDPKEVNL